MEYSLNYLNKYADLKEITVTNFVNTLNLIGLEVDEILYTNCKNSNDINNIKLIIKIPANREDLLNEELLLNEFSTIFLLKIYKTWEILKTKYTFFIKQKSIEYFKINQNFIDGSTLPLRSYVINIKDYNSSIKPYWIEKKLESHGIKCGNSIENIINLTILEWGHNINLILNKYDIESLKFEKLIKNENFISNLNKNYELKIGTLVLKNKNNEILSVIGITNSELGNENTSNFNIEFTFYDIHENSLQLNSLNSKLSFTYLRRMFIEKFNYSVQRILTLIEIINYSQIGKISSFLNEKIINLKSYKLLKLDKSFFRNFLNIDDYDPIIFKKLGFDIVCKTSKELYFRIPNSRKDLMREIDLIEEYSKSLGYKNIVEINPKLNFNIKSKDFSLKKYLKEFLINYNFNEIVTNPLTSEINKQSESIGLSNPLNSELSLLRMSVIPNLIEVFSKNLNYSLNKLKFFEFGRSFKLINKKIIEEELISLIFQIETPKQYSQEILEWFLAKGFIQQLLNIITDENTITFEILDSKLPYYNPSKSAIIWKDNNEIGYFGEIHPDYRKKINVKSKIFICEINLTKLKIKSLKTKIKAYNEYSKYPTIRKDLSFLVNKSTNFYLLKNYISKTINDLKSINFFDIYTNINNSNLINLGIRLEFQSFSETLTTEVVENKIQDLIYKLNKQFEMELIN